MNKLFTAFGFVTGLLILVGFLILGPWLSILAVNQLFGTTIQLTFWIWLSIAWLHIVVASTTKS